jgi:predicted nucleic acid-binding protein
MAYMFDEVGSQEAEAVIFGTDPVAVPFIALMEVEYKLLRNEPHRARERMVSLLSWPMEVVESNPDWRAEAARVKAQGKLSLADAWMASLALIRDAELVHKDPEFDTVPELKALRLPYDSPGRSSN